MPIFNWAAKNVRAAPQPAFSLSEDGDAVNFLIAKSNGYVSADKALKNSDIFSLIMQLSGDLASVQLNADSDRTQSLLKTPSQTADGFSFWQSMFAQLLLDGNAYAYRWRNKNGVDLRWEYLRPSQVQPMLLDDGSGLVYNINFDEPVYGTFSNVPQIDVIHIRLMSKNGGMTGVSPLTALANELDIKDASNDLTKSALKQSVTANGVLSITHGGKIDERMRAARSRRFKKQLDHSDGGPIVIDDLEDYKPLEIKSNIAQLLSQVDWTGKQVAKVYGIPDSYLNGQGDQQSSIQMMGSQYAQALNRYVKPIVSELNRKLNATITADIRPAIDATGDAFADTIAGLSKNYALSGNQAAFVLKQTGYLPADLPKADLEGGEMSEKDRNQRANN